MGDIVRPCGCGRKHDPGCRKLPMQKQGVSAPSDQAVEAVARLARAPRCSDWGEGLTDPRLRALLAAAYPIIRADVIAEVVGALRDPERTRSTLSAIDAADFIEREFVG